MGVRLRARIRELPSSAGMVLRFALVGVLKTALDFGVFNLIMLASGTDSRPVALVANTAGFIVALGASFLLTARYTFRVPARRDRLWRFVAISVAGLVMYDGALILLLALTNTDGLVALNAMKVAALVVSATWNFLGYRYLVFRFAIANTSAR